MVLGSSPLTPWFSVHPRAYPRTLTLLVVLGKPYSPKALKSYNPKTPLKPSSPHPNPKPHALNPKPQTLNPNPQTPKPLNPNPQTPNPKPKAPKLPKHAQVHALAVHPSPELQLFVTGSSDAAGLRGAWGLGFRVWGLGFGVWGLGFGV